MIEPQQASGRGQANAGGSPAVPRLAILHPLLFALLPSAVLLSGNIEKAYPGDALRSTLFVLTATAACGLLLALRWRDRGRAALVATIAVTSCFAFGQLRLVLWPAPGSSSSIPEIATLLLWVALVLGTILLVERARSPSPAWHTTLTIVAAAALIQPLSRIVIHEAQAGEPWAPPSAASDVLPFRPGQPLPGPHPDIYVVILDGYGRADVLHDLYELDNTDFLDQLRAMGFFVAGRSVSNYAQTSLTLASLLNMTHLNELGELRENDPSQREVAKMIRHSEVVTMLEGLGYTVITFPTGYRRADLATPGLLERVLVPAMTPFEALVFEASALWGTHAALRAMGAQVPFPGYAAYRLQILRNIEALKDILTHPGPKLVFAHILIPHPPFIFGPQGEPLDPSIPFRTGEGDEFLGTAEQYVNGYRGQVAFANGVVTEILEDLINHAPSDAVVILMGDHGPGLRLNWLSPEETDFYERHSILYAMRLPDDSDDRLYPSVSPVNTFRIVFNTIFGANLPLLEDQAMFSSWRAPYEFILVQGESLLP